MTDCIIQRHQSLTEMYSSLLIRKREMEREEESGKAVCRLCGTMKAKHYDNRCSIAAGSREFLNDRCEENLKVTVAIEKIEQLMEID